MMMMLESIPRLKLLLYSIQTPISIWNIRQRSLLMRHCSPTSAPEASELPSNSQLNYFSNGIKKSKLIFFRPQVLPLHI